MDGELDLDPELKFGDVLISSHGLRWTFVRWSARGKLIAKSENGTEQGWWWSTRAHMAKGWKLERNGTVIR
jgi:hypothetical protein